MKMTGIIFSNVYVSRTVTALYSTYEDLFMVRSTFLLYRTKTYLISRYTALSILSRM